MVAGPDHERQEPGIRFAVCLAAYNGAQFVTEQIDSILQQRGVDLQLFVSVDQSTDGTESHLTQWAVTEPRLTLLPFGHRFGGAAPNFYRLLRDIDLTGFDYLSFADQDDLWHPDKLRQAHHVMKNQGAAGYSSNFTAFWPSGRERRINKAWPQKEWDFLFESAGPGCTYVLDHRLASAFRDLVSGADDQLLLIDYHDWLAYAFARTHGWRWVIDDWSSMKYRQHANNQIGVNTGWHSFRQRAQKVLAGYGFEQSCLIADLVGVSSLPVVRRGLRGGRLGCLWLALQARRCRRRPMDQFLFFISCLLLAMRKPVAGVRG
jgi:rhamnosyltransferase